MTGVTSVHYPMPVVCPPGLEDALDDYQLAIDNIMSLPKSQPLAEKQKACRRFTRDTVRYILSQEFHY